LPCKSNTDHQIEDQDSGHLRKWEWRRHPKTGNGRSQSKGLVERSPFFKIGCKKACFQERRKGLGFQNINETNKQAWVQIPKHTPFSHKEECYLVHTPCLYPERSTFLTERKYITREGNRIGKRCIRESWSVSHPVWN